MVKYPDKYYQIMKNIGFLSPMTKSIKGLFEIFAYILLRLTNNLN